MAVAGETVTVTVSAAVDYLILPGGRSVSASSTLDRPARRHDRGIAVTERRAPAAGDRRAAAMAVIVVGVPVLLVVTVGNPWPGRTRLELGDEASLLVGVLAVLAWLLWLRFVVAIVVEARSQIAALRAAARRPPTERVDLARPRWRGLVPVCSPSVWWPRPSCCCRWPPAPRRRPPPARRHCGPSARRAALVATETPPAPEVAVRRRRRRTEWSRWRRGTPCSVSARTHLGDAERWREIFELNRDRPQVDGGRLQSPSALRTGWALALPAGAAAAPAPSFLEAATVTVVEGDTLWDLSEARLGAAGAPTDGASVVATSTPSSPPIPTSSRTRT